MLALRPRAVVLAALVAALFLALSSSSPPAAAATISTGAGGGTGDGGPAVNALISHGLGLAYDGPGNLYFADSENCRIRRVDAGSALISTIAGTGTCGFSGDGGPATAAQIGQPFGLAYDASLSVLYFSDSTCRIRKVDGGVIDLVAGTGVCGFNGDGAALASQINFTAGMDVNAAGELALADTGNCLVRLVSGGALSTIAGNGTCGFNGDGLAPLATELNQPTRVHAVSVSDFAVADLGNCRARLIQPGTITTIAGSAGCVASGDGGPATGAGIRPFDFAIDPVGNVYYSDANNCNIRKVDLGGIITTIAGSGICQPGADGPALTTDIDQPTGIAVDPSADIVIYESGGCRIRKVSAGTIETIVGAGQPCGFGAYAGDGGPATSATLNMPAAVVYDPAISTLYIADSNNCRIRKVTAGIITTHAGTGDCDFGGDGGPPAAAMLNRPQGLALDSGGALYIADTENCRVRKIDAGMIDTVAGSGTCGFGPDLQPPWATDLGEVTSVAIDPSGNVHFIERTNCVVRRLFGGVVARVAGNGTCGDSGDGGSATSAQLNRPRGIAIDATGAVYIADSDNCRVRRVSGGTINAFAGNGSCGDAGDGGLATSASLYGPRGVSVGANSTVFIADTYNCKVRAVNAGIISTAAGQGSANCGNSGDGGFPASAKIKYHWGVFGHDVCCDELYLADTENHSVRIIDDAAADLDGDGLLNAGDNCAANANAGQENADRNFIELVTKPYDDATRAMSDSPGDACDDDDDNDGLPDYLEDPMSVPCNGVPGTTAPDNPDSDGDQAIDGAECDLLSDPTNASLEPTVAACGPATDMDGDKILAFREVCYYGTDPSNPNSDGDSRNDGCEAASINGDLSVNVIDLQQVAAESGAFAPPGTAVKNNFDVTKNGAIDVIDLQQVAAADAVCP